PAAAVGAFQEAYAGALKRVGPGHLFTRSLVHHLALSYREAGRPAAAIPELEKNVAAPMDDENRDNPANGMINLCVRTDLAEAYLDCGRPADAVALLQPLRQGLAPGDLTRPYVTRLLIRALESNGQHERAAEVRAEAEGRRP